MNMFELFQRTYSFRAVVYTNSPIVVRLCSSLGIYSEGNYGVNLYNMPLVSSMFNRTRQFVDADYYGYINSDIVVSPNLFDVLERCKDLAAKKKIKEKVRSLDWNER